ncbi:MAG: hypothetical protein EPO46_11435 [Lysobacter sp.]|nr:MAG: hypothetical protein EPO46_11435 [Lysobacter sp.]
MSRYTITESVGSHVESVRRYEDLAKHQPSSGRQPGRDYATVDGHLEEVRHVGGHTYIKKDLIFAVDNDGAVNIPAPPKGYVHYLHDGTNAVRLYDRPFGQPGATMLAQVLHMRPGTSPPEGSRVAYGAPLGHMSDAGSPGDIHAHIEMEPVAFRRYIEDIERGAITPDRHRSGPNAAPLAGADTKADGVAGRDTLAALGRALQPSQQHYGPTPLSDLIGRGEGGYDSFNRGRAGDAGTTVAISQMTIGEIMREQSLPTANPQRLFAVGKFQMIPGTVREAVEHLHIDRNARFTPELQERVFSEFLVSDKRPTVRAYVTGEGGALTLGRAQLALAQEFASVADPRTGRGYYDGDSAGNHASISVRETQQALDRMRACTART